MITNSEALTAWEDIFQPTEWDDKNQYRVPTRSFNQTYAFPFKDTLTNTASTDVDVMSTMVELYLFFKHLKEYDKNERAEKRKSLGRKFEKMYPYIPEKIRTFIPQYKKLIEYFLQEKDHTPIDPETLKPLWEKYVD